MVDLDECFGVLIRPEQLEEVPTLIRPGAPLRHHHTRDINRHGRSPPPPAPVAPTTPDGPDTSPPCAREQPRSRGGTTSPAIVVVMNRSRSERRGRAGRSLIRQQHRRPVRPPPRPGVRHRGSSGPRPPARCCTPARGRPPRSRGRARRGGAPPRTQPPPPRPPP